MRRRDFLTGLGSTAAFQICRVSALAQQLPAEPTADERLAMGELAKTFMDKHSVPGFSVAIGKSGQLLYQGAFGWADREKHEQVTPAHLFRIASISKPITSAAIFVLVERKRLSLDDKVFGGSGVLNKDYVQPPVPAMVENITIEHLLTHTCGGWGVIIDEPVILNKSMNNAQVINWYIHNRPLENPPGQRFTYSNFGYFLLGRVIEKIGGKAYSDFVKESVLSRCGISDMMIGGSTLAQRKANEVKYYGALPGTDPYHYNLVHQDSSGGWIGSPTDLVRFAMNVVEAESPSNILGPDTIKKMISPSSVNPRYAKGWYVGNNNLWHGGSLTGSNTQMVRAKSGFCWAGVTNTNSINIAREIAIDLDAVLWGMARVIKSWRV
jgi:CubicO group peptidase (beta-lactamase class C family)